VGISTDITVTPGQTVSVSGDGALEWAPRWGSGGFDVQARGSLSLTYIGLDPLASVTLTSGGSLSMALMAVSVATLSAAMAELGGADSSLRLEDITVLEYHYDPAQTVAITVNADGMRTQEGSLSFGSPIFNVSSGPCETSQGGQCVGRAQGYGISEDCTIAVSGGGGTLAACSVFDVAPDGVDFLTLPGGVKHRGSDCPVGMSLATDSSVAWTSDIVAQGSVGNHDFDELTDCDAMGTCGLPFSWGGLGGGWEICFVPPTPGCTNPTASDFDPAATVEDGSCTSGSPFRVGVKWENWEGIGEGAAVAILTSSPAYIASTPTATDFLTPPALFEVHTGPTIDGTRLTAYFLAPQSGDYIFVLRSDDRGELWLGPDESTLQLIASGGYSWVAWDTYPSQTSAPQRLEEGSYYLVRALAKNRARNGPGGVAVGVTLPDGEVLRPMPVLGYLFEPPPTIHGCTNPTATNFNLLAEADDSSCVGGRIVGAKLDIWEGISGAMVSDLISNPAYLAEMPTSTEVLTNGALLEVPAVLSAGPNDNDAEIAALGVWWLTGCASFAAWRGADASTGCEIDFIRTSASCDEACQTDDGRAGSLKQMCPDTCGDNLGSRLTAYFRAPLAGDYTFVIAADDTGELWLGGDKGTLQLIASVPERTDSREWDKLPQQTSAPQRLEAGSLYLLNALGKNDAGGQNLAVGVTLPDGEELRPIPVQGYLFQEE
jgi:hypothetical protein